MVKSSLEPSNFLYFAELTNTDWYLDMNDIVQIYMLPPVSAFMALFRASTVYLNDIAKYLVGK